MLRSNQRFQAESLLRHPQLAPLPSPLSRSHRLRGHRRGGGERRECCGGQGDVRGSSPRPRRLVQPWTARTADGRPLGSAAPGVGSAARARGRSPVRRRQRLGSRRRLRPGGTRARARRADRRLPRRPSGPRVRRASRRVQARLRPVCRLQQRSRRAGVRARCPRRHPGRADGARRRRGRLCVERVERSAAARRRVWQPDGGARGQPAAHQLAASRRHRRLPRAAARRADRAHVRAMHARARLAHGCARGAVRRLLVGRRVHPLLRLPDARRDLVRRGQHTFRRHWLRIHRPRRLCGDLQQHHRLRRTRA
mmetsp:Transcript_6919/g.21086  ORF Transcript_6919/g.21086 Transcript_6919/m.21086 type:complete len:310 (-) Transcript_6919:1935-2864(-)